MTTAIQPPEQLGLGIPTAARNIATVYVAHDRVHPDPLQPREDADDELRETIRVQGLLQPIAVRGVLPGEGACADCGKSWAEIADEEGYIIVFGERRWRGAKGVQKNIPVMIRDDFQDPALRLIAQAAENAHKALTPIEEAKQYQRILESNPKMTVTQLSSVVGKAASTVKDRLALLRNKAWVPLLETGEITTSQAVEAARYTDRPETEQIAAIRRMRSWAIDAEPMGSTRIATLADREIAWFREHIEQAYAAETPRADAAQGSLLPDEEEHNVAARTAREETVRTHGEPSEHPVPGARTVGRVAPPPAREAPANRGVAAPRDSSEGEPATPDVPAELPAPAAAQQSDAKGDADVAGDEIEQILYGGTGIFAAVADVARTRPVLLTIGAAVGEGRLRVTAMVQKLAPLAIDGTPEELDRDFAQAFAAHVASAPEAKPAAPVTPPKKAPAKKSTKKAAGKAPAKKRAAKK